MPRPRTGLPQGQTAFAQRLQEWMWTQRPPFTNGQLAYHLSTAGRKITTQAVWNWFHRGSIPDAWVFIQLERVTAIPLVEWYKLAGYPVPEPPAHRHDAQAGRPLDAADVTRLWESLIDRVIRSMKRSGRFSEDDIQVAVEDIRSEQLGVDLSPLPAPAVESAPATPADQKTRSHKIKT